MVSVVLLYCPLKGYQAINVRPHESCYPTSSNPIAVSELYSHCESMVSTMYP